MQTNKSSSSKANRFGGQNQQNKSGSPKSTSLTAKLGEISGGSLTPESFSSTSLKDKLPSWKDTVMVLGGVVVLGAILEGARRLNKSGGVSKLSGKVTDAMGSIGLGTQSSRGKSASASKGSSKKSAGSRKGSKSAHAGSTDAIFDRTGKGSKSGFGKSERGSSLSKGARSSKGSSGRSSYSSR